MDVHFVFIGEGSSDSGLIPHLESLCIDCGATEVTGVAPDFRRLPSIGHSVEAKLRAATVLEPEANLVFIHRDADARSGDARREEIDAAITACAVNQPVVAIVPVQETEAWLLLDEAAIRRAVGRPRSRVTLDLPSPGSIENIAQPKEKLQRLLELASETTGRRLDRIRRDFPLHRRVLLEGLPMEGPLEFLSSWQRLRSDLQKAVDSLASD